MQAAEHSVGDAIPSRMSTIFRACTKETLTLITAKYEEEAICVTNLRSTPSGTLC